MAPAAVHSSPTLHGTPSKTPSLDGTIFSSSSSDTKNSYRDRGETSPPLTLLRGLPEAPISCDVCVVGAGPAGLMLAANLLRFGVDVEVVDDRPNQTPAGRADGLQPKTIETFRQMRLADPLLQRGVRVYDIAFWRSTPHEPLRRLGREIHYPPIIDVLDPYILLVHQGMVEGLFIEDMRRRGKEVRRNTAFDSYSAKTSGFSRSIQVNCHTNVNHDKRTLISTFLVGCDGAHSRVRKVMPGVEAQGISQPDLWGVLDGELITDFPDLWSKTLVYSEEHGSILIVPRERNMTRLYIELKTIARADLRELSQAFIMQQARKIMEPYTIDWKYIEWFGRYQVGQRIASHFSDASGNVFIAGDASHTHSPKSAQGMNTSMHDSWNLAWKLNLASRGFAQPTLLESYEVERRKIALDLVNFDYEHANRLAGGDAVAMAENFRANVRFISGVGADYDHSPLNWVEMRDNGPTPLAFDLAVCYLQEEYPDTLTQILSISNSISRCWDNSAYISMIASRNSFISRLSAAANRSYAEKPRAPSPEDVYLRPERYTAVSHLFTFALLTTMTKTQVEISDLPKLLQDSRWTFYLDNLRGEDPMQVTCTNKWLGEFQPNEVGIINVRPDGYVGSLSRWDVHDDEAGYSAATWLSTYYSGFLQLPS
ncbi:Phenol hydroxylase [Cladobotryum mycophilum]|uniref:Phenol hydroxylase n=1 Tax=Cladobotryum mycophilum TaxID=491253 RepID=A0ABR0SFS6_9HYPO